MYYGNNSDKEMTGNNVLFIPEQYLSILSLKKYLAILMLLVPLFLKILPQIRSKVFLHDSIISSINTSALQNEPCIFRFQYQKDFKELFSLACQQFQSYSTNCLTIYKKMMLRIKHKTQYKYIFL